jgi:hypothetical protein
MLTLPQHLKKLRNFHILTAFISGMNNAAVQRLKWTLKKIPNRFLQILSEIEETMSMEGNCSLITHSFLCSHCKGSFKNYRALLQQSTPPVVPYM